MTFPQCYVTEFLLKEGNSAGVSYEFCRALREERPKKKTVIHQHDNARPHTARLTLQAIHTAGNSSPIQPTVRI
jgi:hypothetical protein